MSGVQTGPNAFAPGCYPTKARATGVSWMLGMGLEFGTVLGLPAVSAVLAAICITASRRASGMILAPTVH